MTGRYGRVDGRNRVAAVPPAPLRVNVGVRRRRSAVLRPDIVPTEQVNRAGTRRGPPRHREVDGVRVRDRRDGIATRHTVCAVDCADHHELADIVRRESVSRLGDADGGCRVDGAGQTLTDEVSHHHREVIVGDALREDGFMTLDERATERGRTAGEVLRVGRRTRRDDEVRRGLRNADTCTRSTLRELGGKQTRPGIGKPYRPDVRRGLPDNRSTVAIQRMRGADIGLQRRRRRASRKRQRSRTHRNSSRPQLCIGQRPRDSLRGREVPDRHINRTRGGDRHRVCGREIDRSAVRADPDLHPLVKYAADVISRDGGA